MLQHFLRGGHLDDLTACHKNNNVGQFQGFAHVVADENNGFVQLLLDILDLVLQGLPGHGIQGTEGFIHQYDGRGCRQRPQHADALLLSAGELRGILVGVLLHVHQLQHFPDDLVALGLVVLQELRHHADVLGHGHVGEQADLLDDVADVAPQFHLVLGLGVLPVDGNGAGVDVDEAVDGF